MRGQCADRDVAVFLANIVHAAKPADVDYVAGLRQAQLHQREETMPAGQNFRFVTVPLDQAQGVFQSFRRDVFKLCRNHFALLLPFVWWAPFLGSGLTSGGRTPCMSFQMRSRLNGMSTWRTP